LQTGLNLESQAAITGFLPKEHGILTTNGRIVGQHFTTIQAAW
jgi:hypothetical protein